MKTSIICQHKDQGFHTFYLTSEGKTYFLFTQGYHTGVQHFFGRGVSVSEALDHTRAHRDYALERTMTKLPNYIRYIEKEYGLEILEQTKRRNNRYYHGSPARCA